MVALESGVGEEGGLALRGAVEGREVAVVGTGAGRACLLACREHMSVVVVVVIVVVVVVVVDLHDVFVVTDTSGHFDVSEVFVSEVVLSEVVLSEVVLSEVAVGEVRGMRAVHERLVALLTPSFLGDHLRIDVCHWHHVAGRSGALAEEVEGTLHHSTTATPEDTLATIRHSCVFANVQRVLVQQTHNIQVALLGGDVTWQSIQLVC